MNKFVLVLLVILSIPFVTANISISKAFIFIEIVNEKPVITDISFNSDTIYEDTDIECIGKIIDDHPNFVHFSSEWFVNDKYVTNEPILSHDYFQPEDRITCQLTAYDNVQFSEPINATITAKKAPIGLKLQKFALNAAGVSANTNIIEDLSAENGFAAVTGYAIAEIQKDSEPFTIRLLIISLVIILLFTVRLLLKHIIKKRSPNFKVQRTIR